MLSYFLSHFTRSAFEKSLRITSFVGLHVGGNRREVLQKSPIFNIYNKKVFFQQQRNCLLLRTRSNSRAASCLTESCYCCWSLQYIQLWKKDTWRLEEVCRVTSVSPHNNMRRRTLSVSHSFLPLVGNHFDVAFDRQTFKAAFNNSPFCFFRIITITCWMLSCALPLTAHS